MRTAAPAVAISPKAAVTVAQSAAQSARLFTACAQAEEARLR